MQIIDNTSRLLGDDLKASIGRGTRLRIAASCFSIYAFEALKSEFSKIDSLQFIFTAPTFVPTEVTDRLRKERREFFIPKARRESGLYGTEFEIQLRNKLNLSRNQDIAVGLQVILKPRARPTPTWTSMPERTLDFEF